MPDKRPVILSVVLTVFILILLTILSIFTQLIALNGVSESQGATAMGISLVCQGVGLILVGLFAGWLTNLVITKFNWNKVLAIMIAVIAGVLLGGTVSILAFFLSFPLAGIG